MPITPARPFKGRHFPGEVIVLCVRWYLRYPEWSKYFNCFLQNEYLVAVSIPRSGLDRSND